MKYLEAFLELTGLITWVIIIFGLATGFFLRLRRAKEENDGIYQKELESLRKAKTDSDEDYFYHSHMNF